MSLPALSNPKLWVTAKDPTRVNRDGDLLFMVLPITVRMEILYRTKNELFATTVANAYQKMPFLCAINGLQYSVTTSGIASALIGSGPIEATETIPDGQLVRMGKVIGGRSSPRTFYLAHDYVGGYNFGQGDPPLRASRAVGGLGPIIINNLPHGIGNLCKRPSNCPATGPMPKGQEDQLVQRNNATYAAQQQKSTSVGKTIVATNKDVGRLLIIVQPNGVSGLGFDAIKQALLNIRCDNAVFFDGSDSSMLNSQGFFHVRQGPNKNETNTVGLAFYL